MPERLDILSDHNSITDRESGSRLVCNTTRIHTDSTDCVIGEYCYGVPWHFSMDTHGVSIDKTEYRGGTMSSFQMSLCFMCSITIDVSIPGFSRFICNFNSQRLLEIPR
ncbi:hypothetical protein TNCV_4178341 [Trichonephila clavipes]|nr:hypothetical protein TNCV_4178341 [Trichonephila clavipes]